MAEYDARVIHEFAERLYNKANTIIAIYTIAGGIIGLLGGYTFGGTVALIGLVIFGGLGFSLGSEKAFQLKLQAQTALCQVKIEENTRSQGSNISSSYSGIPRTSAPASRPSVSQAAAIPSGTSTAQERTPPLASRPSTSQGVPSPSRSTSLAEPTDRCSICGERFARSEIMAHVRAHAAGSSEPTMPQEPT